MVLTRVMESTTGQCSCRGAAAEDSVQAAARLAGGRCTTVAGPRCVRYFLVAGVVLPRLGDAVCMVRWNRVEQDWWGVSLEARQAVAVMRGTRLFMYAAECPTQYLVPSAR